MGDVLSEENQSNQQINIFESIIRRHMKSEDNLNGKIKLEHGPLKSEKTDSILYSLLNSDEQVEDDTKIDIVEHKLSDNIPKVKLEEYVCNDDRDSVDTPQNSPKKEANFRNYPCDQCDKIFRTKPARDAHLIQHTGNYYKCDVCSKQFISKYRFTTHKKAHADNITLKCEVCEKEFQTYLSLCYHMESHDKIPRYRCEVCGEQFSHRYAFDGHKRFHKRKIIEQTCEICHRTIRSYQSSALKVHMRSHRKDRGQECPKCGRHFRTKPSFQLHLKAHDGIFEFKCNVCTKQYISKNGLQEHILASHSTNKPYSCEFCGKKFSIRSGWYAHGKVHANENNFICTMCEKRFGYAIQAKRHMKAAHGVIENKWDSFINDPCKPVV